MTLERQIEEAESRGRINRELGYGRQPDAPKGGLADIENKAWDEEDRRIRTAKEDIAELEGRLPSQRRGDPNQQPTTDSAPRSAVEDAKARGVTGESLNYYRTLDKGRKDAGPWGRFVNPRGGDRFDSSKKASPAVFRSIVN